MTLREFYGWAPTETHTDAAGNTVTVTHSPRFDDAEREAWIALHEYEATLCPQCGNPRSVCSKRDGNWYPQRNICWATATRENVKRRFDAKHRDAKPDKQGFLPDDGVTVWVSTEDLTPDDDFL